MAPSKVPTGDTTRNSPPRRTRADAATAYRRSVLLAVIEAATALCELLGGGVGRRHVVNFLRGNQLPPMARGSTSREDGTYGRPARSRLGCYSLLEPVRTRWIEEVVERLIEEGYLTATPEAPSRLTVSPRAAKALEKGKLPDRLFPAAPRLGEHRETEDALRTLRRELAANENRAPFSIFPNSTLAALSAARPRSLAELALVPGMGEARVRRYGRRILAAVRRTS